jgi:hypothetical protein
MKLCHNEIARLRRHIPAQEGDPDVTAHRHFDSRGGAAARA